MPKLFTEFSIDRAQSHVDDAYRALSAATSAIDRLIWEAKSAPTENARAIGQLQDMQIRLWKEQERIGRIAPDLGIVDICGIEL